MKPGYSPFRRATALALAAGLVVALAGCAAQKPLTAEQIDDFCFATVTYSPVIADATRHFGVPRPIIASVLYVGSKGKPGARYGHAKGLMQIIEPAFDKTRKELASKGVVLPADPYNPRASIFCGAYILSEQFAQAQEDASDVLVPHDLEDWDLALRYYFAGREGARKVRMPWNQGSGKLTPAEYAEKVLQYAGIHYRCL